MKKKQLLSAILSLALGMTTFNSGYQFNAVLSADETANAVTTSGKTETKNTTVTKSIPVITDNEIKECSYSFNISFVSDDKFVENVNAKLIQYPITWTDEEHHVKSGDGKIVSEWNSSDSNPFITNVFNDNYKDYEYSVVVDELPEGYTFNSSKSVESGISGYLDGEVKVKIALEEGTVEENTTPLNGTYTLKLNVMDKVRNTPVEGLDCELYCLQTGDVVAKWNTSETSEMYVEGLEYSFDMPDSYNGNITYAIRIMNLPEKYVFFYGKNRDKYGISGFGLEEFKDGTDLKCTVYLEDTSEDAPKYTYVTTVITNTTTTTTTLSEAFDIVFNDELTIENGEEKEFRYTIKGTDNVSFEPGSQGIQVENSYADGKGILTIKVKGALNGSNMIKCHFGTGFDSITKDIVIMVTEPETFHCPKCGRDVPIEEKVNGPLTEICKDCYNQAGYIGTTAPSLKPVMGDANCDYEVNMADAVIIMQALANPNKYGLNGTADRHLTEQGKLNGDMNGDGLTVGDAQTIQKILLGLPIDKEFKPEWKEVTPNELTTSNASYKKFDKEQIIKDAFLVFRGTINSIKEYEVERIGENGEKLNPVKKTIVEVQVGDVYYGNTEKETIRIYNQSSFSNHYNGSFILRENCEYIFVTRDIDDDIDKKYDVRSHADVMSMGLRDGVMSVIDDIVSVYYEYFNDDESAIAKAIPQEEVIDKMPDEAKGRWFLTYDKDDFIELLVHLFKKSANIL